MRVDFFGAHFARFTSAFLHSEFLFRKHHKAVNPLRNRRPRLTLIPQSFRLVAVLPGWRRVLADGIQARTQRRKENVMIKLKNALALGVAGAITLGAVSPTMALPLGSNGETVKQSAPVTTTDVRWRRGWGWGAAGIGLGAFALGATIAGGPYYGYGPYYGPTYYSYYDDPYYYDGPRCWRRWGRVYCNY
jgi:hypothetical protein